MTENPASPSDTLTVAEALVEFLARAGVRDVFGVAGSTIMPILDGIQDDGRIRYHAARYEQSAADMASGYARASGRLGVVMTHCGPGATSAFSSIVGAARDGVPLLFLTGNEEAQTLAREPYHDWEITRAFSAVTRFSHRVTRADELPHILRRALGEAGRGTTQTVHVDLPEDIALVQVPREEVDVWLADIGPVLDQMAAAGRLPMSRPAPRREELDRAVALLAAAEAPVLVLGEYVQWTEDPGAVIKQCDTLGVPYVSTHGGRGGIGDGDLYLGSIGRFASKDTTAFVGEADVVVTLGAEMSDIDTVRWRIPSRDSTLVCVHPDERKIDLRLAAEVGIVADVGEFLAAVLPSLQERQLAMSPDWLARARAVDRYNGPLGDVAAGDDDAGPALDARLVTRMIEAAPDSWAVSGDPGFGPLPLMASSRFGGTKFLYAYGFGAMGFAVPNLIGAVTSGAVDGGIAVIGDGSFFMSLPSVESIASLEVPVIVLVLDDGGFGSQRQKQQEGYGRNFGVDYDNPDIAGIGAAFGLESRWITSPDDVEEACASLPGRTRGALLAVKRERVQEARWYEGSVKRR